MDTLQTFINGIASRILEQGRASEKLLTNDSVVLRKRLRALNDNDRFSNFSGVTGTWISTLDTQNLWSLNIVQPMIRTNTSAMTSANVKIDIEPRFQKDSKAQMASEVASAIVEQKERLQWTTELEEYIAQEQQLGPGVFVRAFHNPNLRRKHAVPKWESQEVEIPGSAVCGSCGQSTAVTGQVEDFTQCGNCEGMAVIEKMPTTGTIDVPTGYSEFTTGDTATVTIPFFEVRVDDENTQGGNLDRAKWFEHHYAASLDELQLEYPESKEDIRGSNQAFSYSLQWQLALKRNRTIPEKYDSVVEQREVRDIFLTPSMYLNHPVTQDFALKDKDGKVRFEIKKDQTVAEATFEGDVCKEPPVVCFRIVGNSLIDVFICDFREEFSYITFLKDSSSFWGNFLYSVISLQDIITSVLTIQFYHIRRNAITSIVYNQSAFDPESFGEDLIPTKDNLGPDADIRNTFSIVPALTMSGEPMQMMELIMGSRQDVTLTTPALMGQAQPNEPYRAQLLQKQSSLGLLAPAEVSKATAKVRWAKQQLRCSKENWTDEDTEEFVELNPEWTTDFIEAFLHCDLDRDLIVDYVEGSEIPQSLIEREVKLQNLLSQLMALGQVNPEFVKLETLNEVLTALVQSSGLDIDIGNNESNLRLAESRYDQLIRLIEPFGMTQDAQEIQQATQLVTSLPIFSPLPVEDHGAVIEFYGDKARNEASKETPCYVLIACLLALIEMEKGAQVSEAQTQTQMSMAAQAPALQAQQQEQQQQMQQQAQADAQAKDQEQNNALRDHVLGEASADKAHQRQLQLKGIDLAAQQAQGASNGIS